MATVTVEVDVDLNDIDDEELINEMDRRNLQLVSNIFTRAMSKRILDVLEESGQFNFFDMQDIRRTFG